MSQRYHVHEQAAMTLNFNPWNESIEAQLENAVGRFQAAHDRLVEEDGKPVYFELLPERKWPNQSANCKRQLMTRFPSQM
jgi:hypothetical protein